MKKYNQILADPSSVANTLNNLINDGKSICYVIPCHEYDGTLILIVYSED